MMTNSKITVGVDLRPLAGGRQSGVEIYIRQLLPALIKLTSPETVCFKMFFSSWREADLTADWLRAPSVELHRFFYSNRWLFFCGRLSNRPFLDQLVGGADVFFSPHLFLAPLSARCQAVITFHDLSFERYPEFFSWRARFWHRWGMNPRWQAIKAKKLIADSFSTRNDLVSQWGIDPQKITVIYPGGGTFFSLTEPREKEKARVRTRYRLPEKYFLFLGSAEARKNVKGVIRAFSRLRERGLLTADWHLVIAGEGKGQTLISRSSAVWGDKIRGTVHFIGPVAEEDKPLIYALAKIFVYPSFFEGFGFPVLEAMTAGVPVITAQTSSLPEVAGGAARLVNPYLVSDIAEAMRELANDEQLAEKLRQRGWENSQKFSWRRAAEETWRVIQSAV